LPEGAGADRSAYLAWAERLPNSNPPTWLGLAPTVEAHLRGEAGLRVAGKAMALQPDVLSAVEEGPAATATASSKAKALLQAVQGWLAPVRAVAEAARKLHYQQQQLQQSLSASSAGRSSRSRATRASSRSSGGQPEAAEEQGNALVRCLRREAEAGRGLLLRVEADLASVHAYLDGSVRGTNAVRALVAALSAGRVPPEWREGGGAGARTDARAGAGAWVLDVVERVKQGMEALQAVETAGEGEGVGNVQVRSCVYGFQLDVSTVSDRTQTPTTQQVWLGGLFYPEGFVTATRQLAAQRLGRSLEELRLSLLVSDDAGPAAASSSSVGFAVRGLSVEGAAWEEDNRKGSSSGGRLSLSGSGAIRCPLPLAWLCWTAADVQDEGDGLTLPVYLDDSRAALVGQVRYAGKLQSGVAPNAWAQRGAAVVAWRGVV
jgi:dynein heavy chain 1